MKFAKRILDVPPSATFRYSTLAKKEGTINLTLGRPGFDTPKCIVDAAIKALKEGKHHYDASKGLPELREKIADKLTAENQIKEIDAEKIVIGMGAKHILYEIFQVMIDKGDKVALPDPSWVSYESMVKLAEGEVSWLPLSHENGFIPDDEFLSALDSSHAKILVLNSPNNPTGAVYPKKILKDIVKIARANDMWIISDECYDAIRYDAEHWSPGSEYEKTLTVNAFSKPFSMTGWRLGYVACPEFDIIEKINVLQQQSVSNPVTFAQYGALAAFTEEAKKAQEEMVAEFKKRRDYSMERLAEFDCDCKTPKGAFYVFPYFEGKDDVALAESFLENGVGTVPGSPFGPKGRECIRISYGNASVDDLKTAFNRMSKVKGILK